MSQQTANPSGFTDYMNKSTASLTEAINKAVRKIGGKGENDICRYLPAANGGYMHHFTLKKMKQEQPQELQDMISKFILRSDTPDVLAPKQRAPRGSRRKKERMQLSKGAIDKLLGLALAANDQEMIDLLSPKKSLAACKKSLIQLVRAGNVDQELWNTYVQSVQALGVTNASIT